MMQHIKAFRLNVNASAVTRVAHSLRSGLIARLAVLLGVLVTPAVTPACTPLPEAPSTVQLKWSITPSSQTVPLGRTATFAIRIESKENINARVTLSARAADGLPITFDPQRVSETASSSTMVIPTTPATVAREYEIDVTATEDGGATSTHRVTVTVVPTEPLPDFLFWLEQTAITIPPTTTVVTRVSGINGFQDAINLSVDSPTPGVHVRALPAVLPPHSSGLAFTVDFIPGSPVVSPVVLTFTATSGSIVHTATLTVTIATGTSPTTPG